MYEGEWRRGKAAGKGKFSWPSGATFEGEFKAGRMEGYSTFTGSDNDTCCRSWAADRKHGFGRKSYVNGDFYEGMWRRNLQEGHGHYVWKNGNEYIGEWKSSVVSSRGNLIWANGNRYDGQWENGVPKGNGIFRWPDGSCYVGTWSKDPNCQLGMMMAAQRRSPCCFKGEAKKPEQMISKGHKNYELMLNLQKGISYSVRKLASVQMRELKQSDFDPREKFWTRFPPKGSTYTPSHQSAEFRWKDYCPMVLRCCFMQKF